MIKLTFIFLFSFTVTAGEVILKLDPSLTTESFNDLIGEDSYQLFWQGDDSPILIKTNRTLNELRDHPSVLIAQNNFSYKTQFSNDPRTHWGIKNETVQKIWQEVTDCKKIPIAILDTGINFDHEDLLDSFWTKRNCRLLDGKTKERCSFGYNFLNQSFKPNDFNGHGTYIASLIGAVGNNSQGISGLCWKSQIMGLKVLDNFGTGKTFEIVRGVRFAVENGAKILNLSFGRYGIEDLILKAELLRAANFGVLVVTPAGNNNIDLNQRKFWPCSYDIKGMICVGALNRQSEMASFSNFGDEYVDLLAPGVDLIGASIGEITFADLDFKIFEKDWGLLEGGQNCLGTPSPTLVYPDNFCEQDHNEVEIPKVKWPGGSYSLLEFKTNQNEGISKIDLTDCAEDCLLKLADKGPVAAWDFKLKRIKLAKNQYREDSGTSIASAYVTGVAALIWSYNPKFSLKNLRDTLIGGSRKFEHLVDKVKEGGVIWPFDNFIFLKIPEDIKVQISL